MKYSEASNQELHFVLLHNGAAKHTSLWACRYSLVIVISFLLCCISRLYKLHVILLLLFVARFDVLCIYSVLLV